ncbi:MAG: hypothetical protein U0R76_05530 [Candidatus Nanopelagicales bacterium]
MSVDVSTVEPHGGTASTTSVRRRLVLVLAVVVAIGAVLAVWWTQSTPNLAEGSQTGPNRGSEIVPDNDPFAARDELRWRQTAPEAWVAWSVWNEGRYAVTLTSAVPSADGTGLPRRTLRFLPADPRGGTPQGLSGATPTGLVDAITIEPGREAFFVVESFFPAECLAANATSTQNISMYSWSAVAVDARVLGRTTTVDVPMPRRFETPTLEGLCPLTAFGGR